MRTLIEIVSTLIVGLILFTYPLTLLYGGWHLLTPDKLNLFSTGFTLDATIWHTILVIVILSTTTVCVTSEEYEEDEG